MVAVVGEICDKIVSGGFPAGSGISDFSATDFTGIVVYTNASKSAMACREGRKRISWKYQAETIADTMYSFQV